MSEHTTVTRARAGSINHTFACHTCGQEFSSAKACRNRTPKYCSKACYGESLKKYKTCAQCGDAFAKWTNDKFCSAPCRIESTRGVSLSVEHRRALSEGRKASPRCKGPHLYNWKGGKATEAERYRVHNRRRHHRVKAGGELDEFYLSALLGLLKGRCFYCDVPLKGGRQTHLEHLQPVSRGGTNNWQNLVYSCQSCNNQKKDKTLAEFAALKRRPDWLERVSVCADAKREAERMSALGLSPELVK